MRNASATPRPGRLEDGDTLKFGVQIGFGGSAPEALPERLALSGKAAEEFGFDILWVPEHVVQFQQYDPAFPYPYSDDGVAPLSPALGLLEPFTALTFLAAHTTKIRLGTGIAILPQRNPVYFAKTVADLDVLSRGRITVGIGTGWSAQEFAALNVPFEHRGSRTADYLRVARSLWVDEISSFTGRHYILPPCVQMPKPIQRPHPPLFFGGESDAALSRVAEFGQGWMGYRLTPAELPERLASLEGELRRFGRSIDEIEIAISPYDPGCDLDTVQRYADLGVAQIILLASGRDHPALSQTLEKLAESLVVHGSRL